MKTPDRGARVGARGRLLVVASLLAGSALSAVAFLQVRHMETARLQGDLDRAAAVQTAEIRSELATSFLALESLRAFYHASREVERGEFREFAARLLRSVPSFRALGWAPRVPAAGREAVEGAGRRDGLPGFRFTEPSGTGGLAPAAGRPEYFPVCYVEPVAGNEPMAGLDLASDPVLGQALAGAASSGETAAERWVRPLRHPGGEPELLLLLPVYRTGSARDTPRARTENLAGFFLGVVSVGDLVDHALAPLSGEAADFLLEDLSGPTAERLLARRAPATGSERAGAGPGAGKGPPGLSGVSSRLDFPVATRRWSLVCVPSAGFLREHGRGPSHLVLLLGLLGTCLAAAVIEVTARGRARLAGANDEMRREIRERRKVEADLTSSERRFRTLVQSAPVGIGLAGADGTRILENDALCRILGMAPGGPQPDNVSRFFLDPEDFSRIMESVRSSGSVDVREARMLRADGTPFLATLTTALHPAGDAVQVLTVLEDVTARKEVEETLRMLDTAVAQSSDGIIVVDSQGLTRFCNPAWARMHGYEPEELLGKPLTVYHSEAQFEQEVVPFARRLNRTGSALGEMGHLRRDGTTFPTLMSSTVMKDASGRNLGFITIAADITEKRRWEEDMAKVQRLESLGILAGGIAHDFNNILTAVLSNISMARVFGNPAEDISEMLQDAEMATLRARGLTQQLLSFARGGAPVKRPLCIARLLKETVRFSLSGSNVDCEFDLPEDLWTVEADDGQIGQVVQNLVINADQAMAEGGVVRVGAENVNLEEGDVGRLPTGHYVKISVRDQGSGIPEKLLSKIFDPFFTTKEKGRGLGLATTFSIVNRHGGHIRVTSQAGEGTRFEVFLPAAPETVSGAARGAAAPARGSGRLLLIDDEEAIRKSTGEMLRRLGYEVATAREGREAIDLYRQALGTGKRFDAVIVDLTIPGGMGGREAVREMRQLDPGLRAVASSGYSDSAVMASHREHGFCEVVSKPYEMRDLADKLAKVLSCAPEQA